MKTVILPSGFGQSERSPEPDVRPGERVDFRVDSMHVYGRKGARVRLISIDFPQAETLTELAPDIASPALFSTNIAKRLDPHARSVINHGLLSATVENEGQEVERVSVLAHGTWSMDGSWEKPWETFCGLVPQVANKAPKIVPIKLGEYTSERTLLPFASALVRLKITTGAPRGTLVVASLQMVNCELLIGGQVPIEAFSDGGPMAGQPCDAGAYITLTVARPIFAGAFEGEVTFTAEYEILARGEIPAMHQGRTLRRLD
jgi:hypothetical protein